MRSLMMLLVASTVHAGQPADHCNNVQQKVLVQRSVATVNQLQHILTLPSSWYTTDQYGSAYSANNAASLADVVAELRGIREALENGGSRGQAVVDPLKLTHGLCNKCHSGSAPKGGFSTDGELSSDDRLKAVSRILADDASERMPKGKQLDAKQIGLLIQELSRRPAVSDEPPPPTPEYEEPQRVE